MKCLLTGCAALCLSISLPAGAQRPIYGYVDEGGAVHLSNVPVDPRYRVLVPESPHAAGDAAPVRASGPAQRRKAQYDGIVQTAARDHGIEHALLHAVIAVESQYDASAISKKGAVGLMQLMPATARRYGVTDPFDPAQNVSGGARYLRDLLRLFDDDLSLALAAFNAGENSVIRNGYRIPPFRETIHYVPRVLEIYRRYRAVS